MRYGLFLRTDQTFAPVITRAERGLRSLISTCDDFNDRNVWILLK